MTYAMWDTISAKQMEFMRRREKYIAYGGARGGGAPGRGAGETSDMRRCGGRAAARPVDSRHRCAV